MGMAMQIVNNIKSDNEDTKTAPKAEHSLVESTLSSLTSLEKSTPKTISALHKKKPKLKVVKNISKKSKMSEETDEKTVKVQNSSKSDPPVSSKKAQRTLSVDGSNEKKGDAAKKVAEAQKPKRTMSTDAKSSPEKTLNMSEKSNKPKRAMSKDGKEDSKDKEKEPRKKLAESSKDDSLSKGKLSGKGKDSTDSKAVVSNQKSQTKIDEVPANPKGLKK